jgi:hypothetical protein
MMIKLSEINEYEHMFLSLSRVHKKNSTRTSITINPSHAAMPGVASTTQPERTH